MNQRDQSVHRPSPFLARYRIEEVAAQHRSAVNIAAPSRTAATVTDMRRYEQTKGGDPRELRGIPAIGRGVGGAIFESSPGSDAHLRTIGWPDE